MPILGDLATGKQSLRTLTPVVPLSCGTASRSDLSGWLFYTVGEDALQDITVEDGFVKHV